MIAHRMVLDIETALDREAVERTGRSGPSAFVRPWLHRVVVVTTLRFDVDTSACSFDAFSLDTVLALEPAEEPALLDSVEARLGDLGDDAMLVTFNGLAHDLPMLQRRRLHHWLFAWSRMQELQSRGAAGHQDVMLALSDQGAQRWPTLVDACAGLAIPCNAALRARGSARLDPFLVKGQTDVAATFLLHCLCGSAAAGSPALLVNGWTALADHLLAVAPTQPHLTQFATAPRALAAREKAHLMH